MDMEIQEGNVESVTMSEILQLSNSWDRERSTDELLGFIARREAVVSELDSDEA